MAPKQTGIVCATLWRCEQIRYDLPVRSTFIIPCITQKLPRPISRRRCRRVLVGNAQWHLAAVDLSLRSSQRAGSIVIIIP